MRIRSISVRNYAPIRTFSIEDLSDLVVLAGPNGAGKSMLVQGILMDLQNSYPSGVQSPIKLVIEATNDRERANWNKDEIRTDLGTDKTLLMGTLQQNRRRGLMVSSVLNFDSQRVVQFNVNQTWEQTHADPREEDVPWNTGYNPLGSRYQDTLSAIFRTIQRQRMEIAQAVEDAREHGATRIDPQDFPDVLTSYKESLSLLLPGKKLVQPGPESKLFEYEWDGRRLPIHSLSSGEQEVVKIVFDFILRSPRDSIIVFDEPELHLHPELSHRLLQVLVRVGERNQFLLCTHSPDIITASLDSSVVFLAPPKADGSNQAILVREDDEAHRALKLLGQSIGVISLGKRLVLIEGNDSSIDKKAYGAILKDRFPGLVLVPVGGKAVITSFQSIHNAVLERTIWGVEFFMLCDHDALPASSSHAAGSNLSSRLRVLSRYHLENYFLDENVLASVFSEIVPEDSDWRRSPRTIREALRDIARRLVPYTAALTVAAYFRQLAGNLDLMANDCHGRTVEHLVASVADRVSSEKERLCKILDLATIESFVRNSVGQLEESLKNDTDDWKMLIPGKPLLNTFCGRAGLKPAWLKNLYIREAERHSPHPFEEIINTFAEFNQS